MITDEFENKKTSLKRLRSLEPYSLQDENEKLIREKNELEKTIERLEFFNSLLEKEVNELKGGGNEDTSTAKPPPPFYYRSRKRVSKRAFNILFLITVLLGVFALYSIFIVKADYPFLRRLQGKPPVQLSIPPETSAKAGIGITAPASATSAVNATIQDQQLKGKTGVSLSNSQTNEVAQNAPLPKNDQQMDNGSVAQTNEQKNKILASETQDKPANSAARDLERSEAQTQSAPSTETAQGIIGENTPGSLPTANTSAPAQSNVSQPSSVNANASIVNPPPSATSSSSNIAAEKKQLGFYKVASKANFYNKPEANALNGSFIYQFSPVTLEALNETEDFIYVVTTNNLGNSIKGWLSKKDLRKID